MIIKNDINYSEIYHGYVGVDLETGRVTGFGEERWREGGWYWLANKEHDPEKVKELLIEIDKEFKGLYEKVKAVAFEENL